MGALIDGEWVADADLSSSDGGEFERQETTFRDWLDGSVRRAGEAPVESRFDPEPGRYHVYICRACPWAHRVALARRLLGLEDAISLSLVQPERYDQGWEFSAEHEDPLYAKDYLREIYTEADPDYTGRVTVPVLWDKQAETIVNNESREIMRMLDTAFADHGTGVDLWPEDRRERVDEILTDIYDPINNGVYRTGFAGTQSAYDEAVDDLFDALDHWEEVLADQRYLAGDRLTEADLAMFATLVRFDHVYHTHFKCNRRAIHEYPNLWGYTRDLYGTPGVSETVNLDHIVRHYYVSHASLNPKRLVPTGPDIDFEAPHDRDRLPGGPPEALREGVAAD